MASAQLGVEELIHGDRAISKVGLRQIRALLKLSKIGLGLWYESDSDLVAGLPDLLAGLVDLRGRDIVTVGSLIVTWFSGGPPTRSRRRRTPRAKRRTGSNGSQLRGSFGMIAPPCRQTSQLGQERLTTRQPILVCLAGSTLRTMLTACSLDCLEGL